MHVGRLDRPLEPPRWPWEVGLVAFEIARRHRFVGDLASLPDGVEVHVLPTGQPEPPKYNDLSPLRYRDASARAREHRRAHAAPRRYLDELRSAWTDAHAAAAGAPARSVAPLVLGSSCVRRSSRRCWRSRRRWRCRSAARRALRLLAIARRYAVRHVAACVACLGRASRAASARAAGSPRMQRAYYAVMRWFVGGDRARGAAGRG